MKSLFNLMSRLGNAGLSTMQAVGLSAVVGVAGIAGWQALTPDSADQNTAFNTPYSTQDEVVYVAGGGGRGSYGANGEIQSSFRAAPSKAIEMQQREAERASSVASSVVNNPDSTVEIPGAYQFAGSEGLGMGQNEAGAEAILGKGGLPGVPGGAGAGVAGAIAAAQAQAHAQAQAEGAPLQPGGKAGPAGLNGAMARASGNAFNSAYVQQADGFGNAVGAASSGPSARGGNISGPGSVSAGPGVSAEGLNMRARAGFGTDNMGNALEGSVGRGRNSGNGNNLEDMTKQSADIAANRNRSANEGSRIFLASTQNSGGINVADGATTSTGQGVNSSDFGVGSKIGGANAALDNLIPEEELFKAERKKLRKQFWGLAAKVAGLALLVYIPFVGRWARKKIDKSINEYLGKTAEYESKYGEKSSTGKQLDWMTRNHIKKMKWMFLYASVYMLTVMPWWFFKKFNVTTQKDDDNDSGMDYTPTPGGEMDGTVLDLNSPDKK